MELPANFNKYKKLIEFYRAQGIDCLKSNKQKNYFVYFHISGCYVDKVTEEAFWFKNDKGYGVVIKHDEDNSEHLYKAASTTITSYLRRVCNLQMKPRTDEKITFTNSFNECQLIISKQLFDTYCGYAALNEDYNQQVINIPINFDANTIRIFIECLNKSSISFPKCEDLDYYDKVFELMDFLCVKF